jgi:BirA family biotin operon repressor/biotin-[acetyl-CoA-carboxylase] ligase
MVPREEWTLETRRLGRRVLVYSSIESTNTRAATLANDPANDGIAILADEQTAGRGQHGRSWTCQPGVGVLLSVLMFPPPSLRRPVVLAAWAANSVCEVIAKVIGTQATIKWPNDVLIASRKVCGILIEQGRGTVVGIGLNVNQTKESLDAEGLPQAASLRLFTEKTLDCHQVARLLIQELDDQYDLLCQGNFAKVETDWRSHTGLLGKDVVVECYEGTYRGRLRELAWEGLQLEVPGKAPLRLVPEAVKHVTAAS